LAEELERRSPAISSAIDGRPLSVGVYVPWIRPLSLYQRRETCGQLHALRLAAAGHEALNGV
jgi:hypothetical protein